MYRLVLWCFIKGNRGQDYTVDQGKNIILNTVVPIRHALAISLWLTCFLLKAAKKGPVVIGKLYTGGQTFNPFPIVLFSIYNSTPAKTSSYCWPKDQLQRISGGKIA